MISIKFVLKKLRSVNYGAFIKTAKRIGKQEHKFWGNVLADILKCSGKYGAGHVDYDTFEMYKMSSDERSKILTVGKNNELVRALNNPDDRRFFEDKFLFNQRFSDFLKRDWMLIDGKNFDEFKEICEKCDSVIVKPLDESCGRGIEKIYPAGEKNLKQVYNRLYAQNCILVEETVKQSPKMDVLCTTAVNTIRLVTILNENGVSVVAGAVRMGREGGYVDNFNHGGLATILDVSKGEAITDGYDKERNNYKEVPDIGTKIKGFKVPMWEECKAIVCEAAKVVPSVRYVAWDVCISKDKGVLLIEGNSYPGQDVTQYPRLNLGTYEVLKKHIS